ncbi:MAG: lytic transglycosylase domain-containing protein [Acidobacteria bacterium]|nr:lytic transglycosylase domain-containing protein [Acidobacteriota bacterium]
MKNRLVTRAYKMLVKYSGWLILVWWCAIPASAQKKQVEDDIAVRARPYKQFIASAAAKHEADPILLCVVGYLETRFNPAAISRRGARGMMQFMPATAARYDLSDPHNPQAAIDAAARYLRDLAVRFDHRADLVLAAYNAGEATVDAYLKGRTVIVGSRIINPKGVITGGIPPYRETRSYVARGITLLKTLRSNPSSFTQQVSSKMKGDSGQEEKGEPTQGLVRNSIRAISHSEPDNAQSQIRPNVHRRSIYFGRGLEEE